MGPSVRTCLIYLLVSGSKLIAADMLEIFTCQIFELSLAHRPVVSIYVKCFFFHISAVMENSMEEMQEGGGANTEINEEEAEITEKTHNNLQGM